MRMNLPLINNFEMISDGGNISLLTAQSNTFKIDSATILFLIQPPKIFQLNDSRRVWSYNITFSSDTKHA